MQIQEGALPLLELPDEVTLSSSRVQLKLIWRSLFWDVADRRDCRTDQRFAGPLSCYYQKRLALAHSNTVSSATASIVAALNAVGASAKRVTCFRSLREMAGPLLVPESCVQDGHPKNLRARVQIG